MVKNFILEDTRINWSRISFWSKRYFSDAFLDRFSILPCKIFASTGIESFWVNMLLQIEASNEFYIVNFQSSSGYLYTSRDSPNLCDTFLISWFLNIFLKYKITKTNLKFPLKPFQHNDQKIKLVYKFKYNCLDLVLQSKITFLLQGA